jgi:deazaflavin-dependent oxidoreductase (nitroreductase family)
MKKHGSGRRGTLESGKGKTSEAARSDDALAPEWWDEERNCYLTTTGRKTGRLHEIEIWFAVHGGRVYVVSGRGEGADWVKNLRADPEVRIRVGSDARKAVARVVEDSSEHPARDAWASKYGRPRPTSLLVEVLPL